MLLRRASSSRPTNPAMPQKTCALLFYDLTLLISKDSEDVRRMAKEP